MAMQGRAAKRVMWTLGLASIPAMAGFVGGWAVTTVEDVPDRVVAGQPVTLTWTVRQHGSHKMDGLEGSIEASAGMLKKNVRAEAKPGKGAGVYTATFVLPEPGTWSVDVNSGWGKGKSTVQLVAVTAADAARPVAMSDAERGQRLFAAKGCVTCHVEIKAGPPLEGRRYDPAKLAAFLAKPDPSFSSWPTNGTVMPNLGLKTTEISALVAYLNGAQQVGAR